MHFFLVLFTFVLEQTNPFICLFQLSLHCLHTLMFCIHPYIFKRNLLSALRTVDISSLALSELVSSHINSWNFFFKTLCTRHSLVSANWLMFSQNWINRYKVTTLVRALFGLIFAFFGRMFFKLFISYNLAAFIRTNEFNTFKILFMKFMYLPNSRERASCTTLGLMLCCASLAYNTLAVFAFNWIDSDQFTNTTKNFFLASSPIN